MKSERIYLEIAGFFIEIELLPTEYNKARTYTKTILLEYYRAFALDIPPKSVHFKINFEWDTARSMIYNDKLNKAYLNIYSDMTSKSITTYYHISMTHFQIVLRDILELLLAENNGFILHSSAALIDEKAYLFTGPSGAGKSTIVDLLSDEFTPLTDDMAIIKKYGKEYYFYSNPFIEKNFYPRVKDAKHLVEGIYVLKKSKVCKKIRIKRLETILPLFAGQIIGNKFTLGKQFDNLVVFLRTFEPYTLYFPKSRTQITKFFKYET